MTDKPEYPPLPEPDTHCYDDDKQVDVWSHSAEQMHAYLDAHLAARGAAQAAPGLNPFEFRAGLKQPARSKLPPLQPS